MTRVLITALILLAVGALAVAVLSGLSQRRKKPLPPPRQVGLPERWRDSASRSRDFWFGIALLLAVIAAGLLVESLG